MRKESYPRALDLHGQNELQPAKPKGFGVRHYQACWMFGALVFGYFLRVNMSMAIVAMEKPSKNPNIERYVWSSTEKLLILSSFFWGYVVAQLPAGLSAQRYGPKIILSLSTIVCSVLTIIIPWACSMGQWKAVCTLRVLIGFCQGTVYPCVHTLLAKWVPRTERGFIASFVYSGAQVGTSIMFASSGSMSESYIGWPGLFYVSGGLALIWAVAYFVFGSNAPDDSKIISNCERTYIGSLTGNTVNKCMKTPWKAMFTSKPFIALIFAHCGFTWGFYSLLTEVPTYLHNVLDVDLSSSGLLSALPYFVMWIFSLTISPIADTLINRGSTSVESSRKIFNSIAQWVPMVSLIALGYTSNVAWAILLLTAAVGFNAASYVGYMVNHMDLSPNFAGTMMSITNGIANFLSIFAPIVAGAVVKETENDPAKWRIVFFIVAGFYLICNSIFVIFGKATIQWWNSSETITGPSYIVDGNKNTMHSKT